MMQRLLNPKFVAVLAVWALILGSSPGGAVAMPTGSVAQLQSTAVREAQIAQILGVLDHPCAQWHLRLAGVTPAQMREDLATLDDTQLASIAHKAQAVKAGGQLEILIVLLVIAILAVVILYAAGKDVVVKDKHHKT